MYWLDEGGTGIPRKVASANLDGSNPQILTKNDLQSLGKITIDVENQVLYWTQPTARKVFCTSPLKKGSVITCTLICASSTLPARQKCKFQLTPRENIIS